MLENLVNVRCDTYHPNISDSLVNSLRSYIDSVPDYERRTPEFITEVRRRLYFIHENNCQVAKRTYMYPRSRKFDKLLIRYVELEFEVLYFTNPPPQKHTEVIAELRVLRLLQVMLYKAVLKNESLVNENTDAIFKKTVLELLSQVRSTYLVENKLIYNIINKLKTTSSTNGEIRYTSDLQDVHKNLATSDYGTDDDSDFENDTFSRTSNNSRRVPQKKSAFLHSSDCMEVPLTVNGKSLVPTIEFADDDEDNYMVYLQKCFLEKGILPNLEKWKENKNLQNVQNSKSTSNTNVNLNQANSEEESSDFGNKYNFAQETQESDSNTDSCIVLCSDSEDETTAPCLINNNKSYHKKRDKKNDKERNRQEKEQERGKGVVTFELIDDDDDENGLNYMVYLQKEEKTNQKSKIHITKPSVNVDSEKEIVISDSEDEAAFDVVDRNSHLMVIEENEDANEKPNESEKRATNEDVTKFSGTEKGQKNESNIPETRFISDTSNENYGNNNTSDESFLRIDTDLVEEPIAENFSGDISFNQDMLQENMNIITFENEIQLNAFENSKTNFLINPAIVFEKMPAVEDQYIIKTDNVRSEIEITSEVSIASCFEELGTEKPNSPGGPVLSEKMDDLDDIDNLLECRLNDSLLEEILLNDSYLLESQKEFEELECFLFDDKKESRINVTNFLVENDEILQSEITTNKKQLEPLTEAQSFLERNNKFLVKNIESTKNCHNLFKRGKPVPRTRGCNKRNGSKINPLKDFTNNNHQTGKKIKSEYCDVELGKELKYFKHRRENNFRSCRGISNALSKR